jgi:two-component sensor histidine kinase
MDLIADIVAQARAPYRHDGERCLHLAGRRAPVAGMGPAVQKLVAGAGKYGAFPIGMGEIRIRWTVEESAGPPGLHLLGRRVEAHPLGRRPAAGSALA